MHDFIFNILEDKHINELTKLSNIAMESKNQQNQKRDYMQPLDAKVQWENF